MTCTRLGRVLTPLLLLLLAAAPAVAQRRFSNVPSKVEMGIGVLGLAMLNRLDAGDSATKTINDVDQKVAYAEDGFTGFSFGGGLTLQAMYKGVVGGQLDILLTRDSGTGIYYGEETTIGFWGLHIPVLLRGSIPFKFVKPIGFIGPELIIPLSADAEMAGESGRVVEADADWYIVPVAGVGLEFRLSQETDIRLPIIARFSLNPGIEANAGERILSLDDKARTTKFDATWQYQAAIMVGLTYNFSLKR